MNGEQTIKALRDWKYNLCVSCKEDDCEKCVAQLLGQSLSLIGELTEENHKLSTALAEYDHKTAIRIAEEYVATDAYEELCEENEKLTINMNTYGLAAKRLAEECDKLKKQLIPFKEKQCSTCFFYGIGDDHIPCYECRNYNKYKWLGDVNN